MIFNKHSNLIGQHAFLSASKYHWYNYDIDKLDRVYRASLAAKYGTEMHALAHQMIRHGVKARGTPQTFNMYVNDAIGYRMTPEQILYYSDNAFGTADCISFRRNQLRIHDLKTGETRTSVNQLKVYAALFSLEYRVKPYEITKTEMRIYQNDEVQVYDADPDEITHIMDKIITFDKRINQIRMEEER